MEKKLRIYSIIGFVFVSILGTILHFVYDWSGESEIVALFAPVNESSWEHLKLLFFPYMIYTIFEFLALNKRKDIAFSKAIGGLSGMAAIIIFFYTYTGIIGKSIDILNIGSFFIGVIISFIVDTSLLKKEKYQQKIYEIMGITIFIIISLLFFLFTFMPPLIPLFKDPVSLTYGT